VGRAAAGAGRAGGAAAGGAGAGTGRAAAGGAAAAGRLGAAGGVGAGEVALAFFTERIALAGGLWGAGPLLLPFARIRARIREASSSLIELLWLRAAMDSFSAASSTSRLSRPRSLDNS
jgi:hypothetical protein